MFHHKDAHFLLLFKFYSWRLGIIRNWRFSELGNTWQNYQSQEEIHTLIVKIIIHNETSVSLGSEI
jgi:hypothetical protein